MSRYEALQEELRARPRRWLVTGAAGFIGSHLAESLLGLGQTVVGLDNFSTGKRANLEDVLVRVGQAGRARFTLLEGDVRDLGACSAAMSGVDAVLHEAALGSVPRSLADPLASHANNVDGFVNVLMAAHGAGVRRVVFASSSSVYGDSVESPKLESRMGRPLSPYAATKLINEIYSELFFRTHGIDSVGLRYFNVFGPRQDPNGAYAAVIPRWTERVLAGEQCVVYGDGSTSRDFCFVADVVQANLLAACATALEVSPRIFNVGAGAQTSLTQLFAAIVERAARHQKLTGAEVLVAEAERAGDIKHSLASIERARTCLGYEPNHTVAQGLDQTVDFYAAQRRTGDVVPRIAAPALEEAS